MTKTQRSLENLEIVGGNPCLDFANTVSDRWHTEHEYLSSYAELLAWAAKCALIEPAQHARLSTAAEQQPEQAKRTLASAIRLRETIYHVFTALADQQQPSSADIDALHKDYARSYAQARLIWQGEHYALGWPETEQLERVLWPLGYAAGELLRSDLLAKVKACPSCGWLFVDTSKSGKRRWCSMNTCGVRDKMQRYHQRQRSGEL